MLRNEFPEVDFPRLIRLCIVHDLGEAIPGDVPAIDQDAATPKTVKEPLGLLYILLPLPNALPAELVALCETMNRSLRPRTEPGGIRLSI